MPNVICQNCTALFYVKPYHQAKGWGKYCSNRCKYIGQRTGMFYRCDCGRRFYRSNKDQYFSKSGRYFCSKSCQTKWRNAELFVGNKHKNWKNGLASYRAILKRTGRPQVCSRCTTDDVRVLAAHHKDRVRTNNATTNLIWLCHNCHFIIHHHPSEAAGYIVS